MMKADNSNQYIRIATDRVLSYKDKKDIKY